MQTPPRSASAEASALELERARHGMAARMEAARGALAEFEVWGGQPEAVRSIPEAAVREARRMAEEAVVVEEEEDEDDDEDEVLVVEKETVAPTGFDVIRVVGLGAVVVLLVAIGYVAL